MCTHTHMHTQIIVLVLSSVMSVYPAIIKFCATVYQLLYVPSFRGKLKNALRIFIKLFYIKVCDSYPYHSPHALMLIA